jgi:hypothetical protein
LTWAKVPNPLGMMFFCWTDTLSIGCRARLVIELRFGDVFRNFFFRLRWTDWLSASYTLCCLWLSSRVARFLLVQHTKTGKNVPKRGKHTIWP